MSLKVVFLRDAQVDIIDATYYLAENHSSVKSRQFLAATNNTCELLAETPGMGTPRDYGNARYAGMRITPVRRFPKYLIFYRYDEDTLEVLRVIHGARDLQAIFGPEDAD